MLGKNEVCKVGDFGLLRKMSSKEGSKQLTYIPRNFTPIPIRWMAPESLDSDQTIFTTASDVWSFGIVLWEIMNPHSIPYKVCCKCSLSFSYRISI